MKGLLERCFDVLHRFIFKSRPSATLFDNALPEGTVEDEGELLYVASPDCRHITVLWL